MSQFRPTLNSLIIACLLVECNPKENSDQRADRHNVPAEYTGNPVLPGDFADPCILVYRDTFYIYATTGSEATVWRSADFINWKITRLNWPTEMNQPSIWAPAVVQGRDDRFYFYPSVDHHIYAGVADHPMGPFTNMLGADSIFIKNRQWWHKMHSIDADCFIDDDGQAYLYWGSGFDFKDGICAVGKLTENMAGFQADPELITPNRYFEGPHMLKKDTTYYLMYSDSLYYDSTYKVRYAVSNSPLGPFTEGKNSPILKSSSDGSISGPGHHFTFKVDDDYYFLYHRHAVPYYKPYGHPIRQVCIEKMDFDGEGNIERIPGSQEGVPIAGLTKLTARQTYKIESVSSSTKISIDYGGSNAFDGNYGTIWAAQNDGEVWIQADLGSSTEISEIQIYFDYPMGSYIYEVTVSDDGETWKPFASGNNAEASEWPVEMKKSMSARYIKLTFSDPEKNKPRLGVWEMKIF